MIPNTFLKSFLLLTILFSFSCSNKYEEEAMNLGAVSDNFMEEPVSSKQPTKIPERKLIKEGHISFETTDLPNTRKNILAAVAKYQGYIASDEANKYNNQNSNTLIVRVPAENFDALLKAATQGIEKFDSKQITTRDVTEEFLDISARLKTKKELEKRYLELLKKANKVSEILDIEKEIGQLRSDIESIEGRLNYLQDQVGVSTIHFNFYEQFSVQTEYGEKFKTGFKNGWSNLIHVFIGLVNLWPFIILIIAIIFSIRYIRRKNRRE